MSVATLIVSAKDFIEMRLNAEGFRHSIHKQLLDLTGNYGQIWYSFDSVSDHCIYEINSPAFEKNFCLKIDKSGRISIMNGIARAIKSIRGMK